METTNTAYDSYNGMSTQISENLVQLSKCCTKLGMETQAQSLQESRDKLNSHTFAVGILGEFKRGKSTVINALLGEEVMPADILPATATMNRVRWGTQKGVLLVMEDGSTESITVEELPQYVTKQDSDSIARAAKIEEAIVSYPCQFCKNGVDIVDTPGLNDDERMNRITEKTVPKLDAVIMVLTYDSPFSISEADFVRNKLMCSDIGRLIFLVNKMDLVPRARWNNVVDEIRRKIEVAVIDRTVEVYGDGSEQHQAVQRKLADLRIYPISAVNGLGQVFQYGEGEYVQLKGEERERAIERSGMPEFEDALCRLLTEERGMIELSGPVAKIISTANEAAMNIDQIRGSLDVDEESFKETQRNVMAELNSLKEKKAAEKTRLEQRAREVRASAKAQIADCYREIEAEAGNIIDNMRPPEGVKGKLNEAHQRTVIATATEGVEASVEGICTKYAERLTAQIEDVIQQEQMQISQDVIFPATLKINQDLDKLTGNKQNSLLSIGTSLGADFATNVLALFTSGALSAVGLGFGGMIEGYRAAGAKGAALGGASGFALSFGTMLALGGLGLGLVGGFPLLAVSAVAGTFGGGAITKAVFQKDRQDKQMKELKEAVRKEVNAAIQQMKNERSLEKWVEQITSEYFDSLVDAVEKECSAVIEDTQRKLEEIKRNLALGHAERETKRKELDAVAEEVRQIVVSIAPLQNQLEACVKGIA